VRMVAAAYFAYLAGLAIARGNLRAAAVSLASFLSIFIIGMPHVMPLVYLLAGYWLPALLVNEPDIRSEQRLLDMDRKLFGTEGLARFEQRAPRALIEYLELSYLLCYAVVPAGYACLVLGGYDGVAINRFWSVVLFAAFVCYGLLPWVPTRAPRAIEPSRGTMRSSIRKLNLAVLDRASVQWNTFPSGHTAASMATALAVGRDMPLAGMILGVVAISIASGSVVGRYHYAADAMAGAAVAILAFMAAGLRGL
jgi:membrane-associated phospholipid phosphatase